MLLYAKRQAYNFFEELASVVADNSIEQSVLVEKLEAALLKAAQKAYPYAEPEDFRVEIDPATNNFHIYMRKSVVLGEPDTEYQINIEKAKLIDPTISDTGQDEEGELETVECELDPVRFGRSIAQFAKQTFICGPVEIFA